MGQQRFWRSEFPFNRGCRAEAADAKLSSRWWQEEAGCLRGSARAKIQQFVNSVTGSNGRLVMVLVLKDCNDVAIHE